MKIKFPSASGVLHLEPQRPYKFEVSIPALSIPKALISSIQLPQRSFAPSPVYVPGGKYQLPDFIELAAASIEFIEDSRGTVINALDTWKRLIQDPERKTYGYPIDYQTTIWVQLADPSNNVHTEFKLIGAWPSGANAVGMSYKEGNAVTTISQDFSIQGLKVTKQTLPPVISFISG